MRSALLDQIEQYRTRMIRASDRRLRYSRERLTSLAARLGAAEPSRALNERRGRVEELRERLRGCADRVLPQRRLGLMGLTARLGALNPENVLERGYAMVSDDQGRWLNSAAQVEPDMMLNIRMWGGRVASRAIDVTIDEGGGGVYDAGGGGD
jgi:exodeoxyribonuclease VII large subunit